MINCLLKTTQVVAAQLDSLQMLSHTGAITPDTANPDSLVITLKSQLLDSVLAVLRVNSNNSGASFKDWLPVFGGIAVVILGAIAQYWITKRQIKATAISSSRLDWINKLIDSISEYMSYISYVYMADGISLSKETQIEKSKQLLFFQNKSILLLDKEISNHRELIELLKKTTNGIRQNSINITDENLREIFDKAGDVTRQELEKLRNI